MTDRLLGIRRDLSRFSHQSKETTSCAQSCSKEQGLEKMPAVKNEKAYLILVRKIKLRNKVKPSWEREWQVRKAMKLSPLCGGRPRGGSKIFLQLSPKDSCR